MSHNFYYKFLFILIFYTGWFGCVYLGKIDLDLWSLIFPMSSYFLIYHFQKVRLNKIKVLLFLSIIGISFDFFLYKLHWTYFPGHTKPFLPLWLISLWFLFSTTFSFTHAFFKSRIILIKYLGSLFGPLSYFSGEWLGVFSFQNSISILFYALFWFFFLPFGHFLYGKIT